MFKKKKNYKAVLIFETVPNNRRFLKPIPTPKREGGNVIIELNIEEYRRDVA